MTVSARVGVVIPVYNGERYLSEALASVAGQLAPPTEVVVVDDGSTDRSGDIAASWGAPVRCVRQDNAGAGAARNRGLDELSTEIVAFLDADDCWTAAALTLGLAALDATPEVDIAHGEVEEFFSPDLPAERRRRLRPARSQRAAILPGSTLIRRRAFERVGGFDVSLAAGEFIEWCVRARAAGVRTVAVTGVVLRRRLHGANQGLVRRDAARDYLRVARAALEARRRASGKDDA
jgi:GT2 family glycosyltransferase